LARRRPGLIRPLAMLAAAAAIGAAASRDPVHEADERARSLITRRRTERLDRFLPVLTDLGSMWAALGTAAALWALGRRRMARDVIGASAIAWSVAQGAKPLFARTRPYDASEGIDVLVRRPSGLSYPSGHPAVANAIARVLEPQVRAPLRPVLARIPRMVSFSRIYVGVHYPTDVWGGALIGRAVGDLWRRFAPA
jgi:membrane-associated phospholipid phosphatase